MIDLATLRAPFAPERVSWRVGSTNKDKTKGMALAYIDARDVQDRLDEVCGPGNWQCRYSHATDRKTVCEIGVCLDGQWVWKADGAGDTDVEAEKGALSDAFKRAAVRWGIGRYLYDLDSPWVDLEERGRSYVIKPSELSRLAGLLGAPKAPPKAASPLGSAKYKITPEQWAENAKAEILACRSNDECAAWRQKHYAAMSKLDADHPKIFERVAHVLHTHEYELRNKAA